MQNYAITHSLTPFISMQNHYNLVYREEEQEMYPTLKVNIVYSRLLFQLMSYLWSQMFGVGSIPWSLLARGLLTRPYTDKSLRGDTDWFISAYNTAPGSKDIINRVEEIAKKRGISMTQVAVAWTLSKDHITAPIVGRT